MVHVNRFGFVFVLAVATLIMAADSADGQRRRGRGGDSSSSGNQTNQSNQSNQSQNQQGGESDEENQPSQANTSAGGNQNSQQSSNNSRSGNRSLLRRGGGQGTSQSGNQNTQQNVQQGVQQLLQGGSGTGNNMQPMRGNRGQQVQQGRRGQSIMQQGQNFQPWQMWQPQGLQGNRRGGQSSQQNSTNWFIQLGGGPAPFTMGWYDHHPQAWHWHKNNNGDAWKIATAASVIAWLGWGGPNYGTTIIYEPVPAHTIVIDPDFHGQWMPLGVYSLLTGPADTGTRILQLSISQNGWIRGSYYDMITNETYNVRGRIDQSTQYVQWSIDTNHSLVFYTPLSQLTQSQGVVNVKLPGGTQQWQLVRMEYAN
jgi:hypothetical protein